MGLKSLGALAQSNYLLVKERRSQRMACSVERLGRTLYAIRYSYPLFLTAVCRSPLTPNLRRRQEYFPNQICPGHSWRLMGVRIPPRSRGSRKYPIFIKGWQEREIPAWMKSFGLTVELAGCTIARLCGGRGTSPKGQGVNGLESKDLQEELNIYRSEYDE